MNRKLLWAVRGIGLALVIAPLALSLPSKASAGERMLNSFEPIMGNEVPTMAAMLKNLPQMQRDFGGLLGTMEKNVPIFSKVPAGLRHYRPLVTTMQRTSKTTSR